MLTAFSPFWLWPMFQAPEPANASAVSAAAPKPTQSLPALPMLPSRSMRDAAPQRDAETAPAILVGEGMGLVLEGTRQFLRRVSLSMTALSSRAQALFAQLAASLAYDRAMRDARRAQEAFAAASLYGREPDRASAFGDIPFVESMNSLWQSLSAAAAFWRAWPGVAVNPMVPFTRGPRPVPALSFMIVPALAWLG